MHSDGRKRRSGFVIFDYRNPTGDFTGNSFILHTYVVSNYGILITSCSHSNSTKRRVKST